LRKCKLLSFTPRFSEVMETKEKVESGFNGFG
jgi:hypothetical protein